MLIFEVRLSGFPSRCVVTAAADVAVDASPGCFFPLLRLPTLPFVVFATRFRSNLVDVVIVVVVVVDDASFVFISSVVVVLVMIIIFLFPRIDEITDVFGAAASTAFRRFRFFFLLLLLLPLLSPFPVLLSFATTMLTMMMMTTRMTTMTTSTAARGSPSSSLLFRHVGLWQIDRYKDSLGKERSRQTSTSISVSA